jgi:hypothetical protein
MLCNAFAENWHFYSKYRNFIPKVL